MSALGHTGLVLLALAALSGWLVLATTEKPEWFKQRGITQPMRFRQTHLDWVMMGLILIAVDLAVPDLPTWIAALVLFGTVVNPLLFLPLAWGNHTKEARWYQAVTVVSFAAMSIGLPATAIWAIA